MNTFSTAWLRIPAGGKIVVKGEFPHMRRWSFTAYPENGAPRDAEPRRYTFSIASGAPPEHRPANTVYTLAEPGTAIGMHMRNYVPDRSVDWVGGFALQEVELHDDGRALKDEEPGAATQEPLRGKQAPLAVAPRLCQALPRVPWVDRETAPATPFEAAPMEMFFNREYLILKHFLPALAFDAKGDFTRLPCGYGENRRNHREGAMTRSRKALADIPPCRC